jgi:hypothetical protein
MLLWRVTEKATMTNDESLKRLRRYITEKAILTCNWKDYSDVSLKMIRWRVTGQWKGHIDMSLKMLPWHVTKRLLWRVTEKVTLTCHWTGYGNEWRITEKATPTCHWKATLACHWKGYGNEWQVTKKATPIRHWKGYPDMQLKKLIRRVTEKATVMSNRSLKRLHWHIFTRLQIKIILTTGAYKSTSSEKKHAHT